MGMIAPYIAKVLSYFSWTEGSFLAWLHSPLLPSFHVLLIILVIALLIYVFSNAR